MISLSFCPTTTTSPALAVLAVTAEALSIALMALIYQPPTSEIRPMDDKQRVQAALVGAIVLARRD